MSSHHLKQQQQPEEYQSEGLQSSLRQDRPNIGDAQESKEEECLSMDHRGALCVTTIIHDDAL